MKKLFLFLSLLLLLTCAKDSTEDNSSVYVAPPSNTTNTTTTPTVTQYTLTVTAGIGGSVSTAGGTYNDGTSISITATPSEGYGFAGWNGSNSSSSTISVTLTANTTIEALFGQLPQLTLPESPSKMFTKGVGDTLSIGFSHAGGYKSTSLSAEYGSVSVISEPNEGDTEGNIVIEYTVHTVENVDIIRTIAGFDDIEISFTGADDIAVISEYQVRTQPEPVYKDYLKPSHDLTETRSRIDISYVRYLNQRDNYWINYCNGIYDSYNEYGSEYFITEGLGFADVNGDGYDDLFTHPSYTSMSGLGGFTSVELEFELYLYLDGSYVYTEIDWGGKEPLKKFLTRKMLIGDFDNDGDADFYAVNSGTDSPPWPGEHGTFIINNYNLNGTLDYKDNTLSMGSHEASSGDLDGDGLLDIFSVSQTNESFGNTQWLRKSKFFKNDGNFNLSYWDDRIVNVNNGLWDYKTTSHSEIVDIDKDGNLDLITMGHEWDRLYTWCSDDSDGNCGRGKIFWGDSQGKFDFNRVSLIPIVRNFGTSTDLDIVDINGDGINEIIVSRTGGDIDSFPDGSDLNGTDLNANIGVSNYYGGHYIQINTIDSDRNIIDKTDLFIENNYNSNPNNICTFPENAWFYWTNVYDFDGNGMIDIFNTLTSTAVRHRWEWNGSKFIKQSYTNPFGY